MSSRVRSLLKKTQKHMPGTKVKFRNLKKGGLSVKSVKHPSYQVGSKIKVGK